MISKLLRISLFAIVAFFGFTFKTGNYPQLLDYSMYLTPVRDAGPLNTRNAFAILYASEYQIFRKTGKKTPLSALHLYYQSKNQEDTIQYNRGILVEDAFQVMRTTGVLSEYSWPYERRSGIPKLLFSTQISERYKVKDFRPVFKPGDTKAFENMQDALYELGPIIVEIQWPSAWSESDGKQILPDTARVRPGEIQSRLICVTGFNHRDKYFMFKSANGKGWGFNGYGHIAYEDMRKLMTRAWIVEL